LLRSRPLTGPLPSTWTASLINNDERTHGFTRNCPYVATHDTHGGAAARRARTEAARELDPRRAGSYKKTNFVYAITKAATGSMLSSPSASSLSEYSSSDSCSTSFRALNASTRRFALHARFLAHWHISSLARESPATVPRSVSLLRLKRRHSPAWPGAPPPFWMACVVGRSPAQMWPPAGAAALLALRASCTFRGRSRQCIALGRN